MKKTLTMLVVAALFAGAALASDGTVGKVVRERLMMHDGYGRARIDCKLSLFTVKVWKDGATVSITPGFRNYTTGMYEMGWTPDSAGEYAGFAQYSAVDIVPWTKTVRAYDEDTARAALDDHLDTQDTAIGGPAQATALTAHDTEVKAAVAAGHAATDGLINGIDDDPWDNPSRTVTGGTVDTAFAVAGPVDITFAGVTSIEARLASEHGSGLWSAAGSVAVLPFQGTVSYEAATRAADVHVVRGDSAAVPYTLGTDLTGWEVWFGAKSNPADELYSIGPRDITAYVTDPVSGSGLVNLSGSDTGNMPRRYFAEIEIRKQGETNTPLRFFLWIDADIIR